MPLFYQHNINENTKLGIWKIEEPESFFLAAVPQHRAITHPHKRLQHLAGRYLLKHLFPDFPYEEITIADTRKPFLPDEQYHFSISHCGGFAAAIVSKDERVGIDAEIPCAKIENISPKFLNAQEQKSIAVLKEERPDNGNGTISELSLLTVLWSAKEAVYKWWGWGGVDFANHILLHEFRKYKSGFFYASFTKKETPLLVLHYKVFEELCLVWVC